MANNTTQPFTDTSTGNASSGKTYVAYDASSGGQGSARVIEVASTGKTTDLATASTDTTSTDTTKTQTNGTSGDYSYWSGGSSSSSSGGAEISTETTSPDVDTLETEKNEDKAKVKTAISNTANLTPATIDRLDYVSSESYEKILNQLKEAQEQQTINTVDYGVNQNITELQRTEQDAQEDYQTQRNQIAADEQRALDNQVLYAASRGDNGGIGQSQYGAIQNTAAVNRLAVNKEQTKLATDTQRQIADLRAQGEFDKADQLLSISQNYLSQLMSIKQWADETNVGIDEFNAQLAEWEANYAISLAEAQLNAASTAYNLSNTEYTNRISQLASAGEALIQAGIAPTAEQLEAMAWTTSQGQRGSNAYGWV